MGESSQKETTSSNKFSASMHHTPGGPELPRGSACSLPNRSRGTSYGLKREKIRKSIDRRTPLAGETQGVGASMAYPGSEKDILYARGKINGKRSLLSETFTSGSGG